MGSPALFSGNFVKFLKNKLNLFDAAYILTGTQDPRLSATDAPKGSILLRQNAGGDGQLFLKLDAGSTVNWVLIPGTNLTGDQNKVEDRIQDQLDGSFYQFGAYNIARLDSTTKNYATDTTATLDIPNHAFDFAGASDDIVSLDFLDPEFRTLSKDLAEAEVALHYLGSAVDPAPQVFVSRAASDTQTQFHPVTMERVGQSNLWVGRKEWKDDFKANFANFTTGGASTFSALTNAAGTIESVAVRFNGTVAAPESYYISRIGLTVTRGATAWTLGEGSFRVALYESSVNNQPSALLAASDWVDMSTITTGDQSIPLEVPSKYIHNPTLDSARFFYAVIETDASYKTNYSAGTKELRARRDSSPTISYTLDGTTWSAAAGNFAAFFEHYLDYADLLYDGVVRNDGISLNATDQQWVSQPVAIPASEPYVVKTVSVPVDKTGTPAGYLTCQIIATSGSDPSTDADDIIAESTPVNFSDMAGGYGLVYFSFGDGVVLPAGATYHFVFKPAGGYVFGANSATIGANTTVANLIARRYNGTTWSAASSREISLDVFGRELSGRVRVFASAASKLLGYGVLYDREATAALENAPPARQVFHFTNTNDNEFPITVFNPHPDFVKCHYVQGGQTFVVPAFTLQGATAVFPEDSFNTTDPVTLIFEQTVTGIYDYSDLNALLMAENHLGSTDPQVDRSAPGRGILLRRPDGTLREVALNNDDELEVYSV